MKSLVALLVLASFSAFASEPLIANTLPTEPEVGLTVLRNQLGTGHPAQMITIGTEKADYVDDGYYHPKQYMPNYPTAAVIWPRVVQVECDKVKGELVCDGYNWSPAMGRGEYLFVMPHLRNTPEPVIVQGPPVIVYKEVVVKKKRE
jgi:hypothetical protein